MGVALAWLASAAAAAGLSCGRASPAPVGTAPEAGVSSGSAAAAPSVAPVLDGAEAAAPDAPLAKPSPTSPKTYKVVVHTGDSMVGGGLCKALAPKFQAEGTKFVRDVWEAASLPMFAESDRLPKLIKKYDPDLVLISLGANDILTVHPEYFGRFVDAIVKKVGDRDCYWIGPPPWKIDDAGTIGEHGLIDVMREHATPCRFFDSAPLVLERRPDGIHPTEKAGVVWADALWAFLRGGASGS